jgi:hypothetical protein
MREEEADERPTPLDRFGFLLGGLGVVGLATFPIVGRRYAAMFSDFGGQLPTLTLLAISWWFPVLLALVDVCLLAAFAGPWLPLRSRRASIVAALLVAGVGFALCVVGLYLPIFSLAGAIKAE